MDFGKYAADIIREAAKSNLGIIALSIIALSTLAGSFFKKASVRIRLLCFLVLLGAVVAFGYKTLTQAKIVSNEESKEAAVNTAVALKSNAGAGSATASDDWEDPAFEEARVDIRWVINGDARAKKTYDQARSRGLSKYQSVIVAQAHNSHAQDVIAAYGEVRSERYIASLGH